jgi:hypothetical protein
MHSLINDIEKSAGLIFRLFFNSDIQVKNNISDNCSPWGVDLVMDCGGKRKLSLFMEEDLLRSVMKQLTGEDNIKNSKVAYEIIGEIARFIASNAIENSIGEKNEEFTLYHPVQSKGIAVSNAYSKSFSSNFGNFYIAVE